MPAAPIGPSRGVRLPLLCAILAPYQSHSMIGVDGDE